MLMSGMFFKSSIILHVAVYQSIIHSDRHIMSHYWPYQELFTLLSVCIWLFKSVLLECCSWVSLSDTPQNDTPGDRVCELQLYCFRGAGTNLHAHHNVSASDPHSRQHLMLSDVLISANQTGVELFALWFSSALFLVTEEVKFLPYLYTLPDCWNV